MTKGSSSLCSALVFLAIAFTAAFDTNISYQIEEFNKKLTYLQDRLDLFDYITEGNVSVLQHRVEINESKFGENVTAQMKETNVKVNNLVDRIDALATDVSKLNAIEYKLNALVTTVSSNASTLLHRVEEKDLKHAENIALQMNVTNVKVNNLVDRIDALATDVSKLNAIESKLNALVTTVSNFVGGMKDTLLKPSSSCTNAFANPILNRGSGIYNTQLNGYSSPFHVYCTADPKGSLPWTVVQRRVDDTVDFYRNWTEYQRGFGDLEGNFFIGLDKLHSLTTKGEPQELWVMLTDPSGISAHAYYDRFAIGNEGEKYHLKVLGKYSGDAGDSLTNHKSMKFSTNDNDNDSYYGNCAQSYQSAWWFASCHRCHLNGVYNSTGYNMGLSWHDFRDPSVSMKYAHMAIRPARK